MLIDRLNEFCDNVALNTGAPGTFNLGSAIDLVNARNVGNLPGDLYLVVEATVTATSGGSATAQFQLVSDDSATPDTGGAQTVHAVSPVFAVADMTAGKRLWVVQLPTETPSVLYEQFIAIQQITGGAAFTAGSVDAMLVPAANIHRAYPDAQN